MPPRPAPILAWRLTKKTESMAPRWYAFPSPKQKLGGAAKIGGCLLGLADTAARVVPFAGTIKDGETVKIECVDW